MEKLAKKLISLKVIESVSLECKLLKTVGLLAVRLDLAKQRLKTRKKGIFD